MERRLTEERITRRMLSWLKSEGWLIVAYDYPQSGTGYSLHSVNRTIGSKNDGAIIPDIVATRNGEALFFENKVDFSLVDIQAIEVLKDSGLYDESIAMLLKQFQPISKIRFGFALKNCANNLKKLNEYKESLDFAFLVNQNLEVTLAMGQIS